VHRSHGICLALALLLARPGAAKDLWTYDWVEVRSPHFVIASALDEKRTRDLAVDLENFRTAAELLTTIGRFEERIPTKLYVLPRADWNLGFHASDIAGYFLPGMRPNYALIKKHGSLADEIIKHEYVRFLVHNRDATLYPLWFEVGSPKYYPRCASTTAFSSTGRPCRYASAGSRTATGSPSSRCSPCGARPIWPASASRCSTRSPGS
jgi:hypothetical protein